MSTQRLNLQFVDTDVVFVSSAGEGGKVYREQLKLRVTRSPAGPYEQACTGVRRSQGNSAAHIVLSIPYTASGKKELELELLAEGQTPQLTLTAPDDALRNWSITGPNLKDGLCTFTISLHPDPIEPVFPAAFLIESIVTYNMAGTAVLPVEAHGFEGTLDCARELYVEKRYPAKIRRFAVNPATIPLGGAAQLSWHVENARNCSITGLGEQALMGAHPFPAIYQPTTWRLDVFDSKGICSSQECGVHIEDVCIASFTAEPAVISRGGEATLHWEVSSASQVNITPDIGRVETTGSTPVRLAQSTEYLLTALGYQDDKLDIPQQPVRVQATSWRFMGNASLRLPPDPDTPFQHSLGRAEDALAYYAQGHLYSSGDGVTWSRKACAPPADAVVKRYIPLYTDQALYLLGCGGDGATTSATLTYSLKNEAWTVQKTPMPVNGAAASAFTDNQTCHHANLAGGSLNIAYQIPGNRWSVYYRDDISSIANVQMAYCGGKYYMAQESSDGTIKILYARDYFGEWLEIDGIAHEKGGWYALLAGVERLYFIDAKGVRDSLLWDRILEELPVRDKRTQPLLGMRGGKLYLIEERDGGSAVWILQCY